MFPARTPVLRIWFPAKSLIWCRRASKVLQEAGSRLEEKVKVTGRIMRKAASGAKLIFFDLVGEGAKVQMMCDARTFEGAGLPLKDFQALMNSVKRGDIVGVEGFPGKSKRGELSIFPTGVQVLAPCLHQIAGYSGLTNQETRYRQRYLDLIMNPRVAQVFRTRARIVEGVRSFLNQRGFLEVETPMMQPSRRWNLRPQKLPHEDRDDEDEETCSDESSCCGGPADRASLVRWGLGASREDDHTRRG